MKRLILLGTVLMIMLLPMLIYAQPGLPNDPPQTPIDGGLIWMLIAGGAYGLKKLKDDHIQS